MRNDICTIPVNEIFEKTDGCPVCRMLFESEEHILDYILGAAAMEPDVRIETNRLGFCPDHLKKMAARRGRLPFALMLDTHLAELKDALKSPSRAAEIEKSCFICEKVNWGLDRMIDTIYRSYEQDADFRAMFDRQPEFCLPHYNLLLSGADKKHMKRYHAEFRRSLYEITLSSLERVKSDLSTFCSLYDYRRAGSEGELERTRDAVERSMAFLSGRLT